MSVEGVSVDRPVVNVMDLIDRILDKGLVIDLYIRLALVGIELLEIQARIVISGVESYIKYAGQMQKLGLVAKPLSTA
ncbi:MAG: gas vesicle protein GvpJ [Nitrososphaerales archaeon]|jgi:gas vesicle structural protein|nr:gas vesicle protein [archaeon]